MIKIFLLIGFFLFLTPLLSPEAIWAVEKEEVGKVVINEIAWMGGETSYTAEWIELYNNDENSINLDGWLLKAVDGKPEIKLKGEIPPKGFYLLERIDDSVLPKIPADQIYNGALSNQGEALGLYDRQGNLIDFLDCSAGWPAGSNSTKQTMERINSLLPGSKKDNWTNSQNPGGTPKAKNSIVIEPPPAESSSAEAEEEKSESLTAEVSPERAEKESESEPPFQKESQADLPAEPQLITYPSAIIINEILPSPIGPDAEKEWIEIFNQSDFEINLSGWQIKDLLGRITVYIFPQGKTIGPREFLILSRPITKITLNNNGDGLKLLQPDGQVIDELTYQEAIRGHSYNRWGKDNWYWSRQPTPGQPNFLPPSEKEKKSSWQEKSIISEEKISFPDFSKNLEVCLAASLLAIFSALAIFTLKKKLKLE